MKDWKKLYLKKVVLQISRRMPPQWISELRSAGVEAEGGADNDDRTFEERGSEAADDGSLERGTDKPNLPAKREGVLWITDDTASAQEHILREQPVLAFLHEENRGASFPGVKFACENLQELDAAYLDRVYRRYALIPWDILETERCFLRETAVEDVNAFYEIYGEPSVTEYMEDLFPDREQEIAYTRDYIRNVYEFYGFGVWTVCLKETGQVIGRAGLSYREGFADPELGFVIGVPWQRRGIGEEVCRAVLAFGKKELGFETVIAFAEPGNGVSVRLLEKLGFQAAGEKFLQERPHVMFQLNY